MEEAKVSRQRAWQKRKVAEGLCLACAKEPLVNKSHCVACREVSRERNRARLKAKKENVA